MERANSIQIGLVLNIFVKYIEGTEVAALLHACGDRGHDDIDAIPRIP